MPPYFRLAIRIIAVIAIITLAAQPYNWYCSLTQECRAFSFSYFIPKREGKREFNVEIQAQNYFENIEFYPEVREIVTPTNRKQKVIFHIKNLSKKYVILRPKILIQPEPVEKYIVKYQCPCGQQIRLKGLQEITSELEFEIDSELETQIKKGSKIKTHQVEPDKKYDFQSFNRNPPRSIEIIIKI